MYIYICVCVCVCAGGDGVQMVILLVMVIEAVVVMIRGRSHVRVMRALRPFFLTDCHYCTGIRRSHTHSTTACPAFFVGGARPKGRKSRPAEGVRFSGINSPPRQLGGPGSAVRSPSAVRGGAPICTKVSTIFSAQGGLS